MLVFFSRMKNPLAILLFGVLSMLFAEVFSGSSTLWFIAPWGVFLTLSLYLGHALFFFNVAVRTEPDFTTPTVFFWDAVRIVRGIDHQGALVWVPELHRSYGQLLLWSCLERVSHLSVILASSYVICHPSICLRAALKRYYPEP